MATYVPNAETVTEPVASREVGSAAEEFRTLKEYIQELAEDTDSISSRAIRTAVSETIGELSSAASRANKLLGFDSVGGLTYVTPDGYVPLYPELVYIAPTTDDVTAEIIAQSNLGKVIVLGDGQYTVSNAAWPTTVRLLGLGKRPSELVWAAGSAESDLIALSGVVNFYAHNVRFNGNRQNQTDSAGYYGSVGGTLSHGSTVVFENCEFINGRISDIYFIGPSGADEFAQVSLNTCKFSDGLVGTASRAAQAVGLSTGIRLTATKNKFLQPAVPASYGRGGIVMQRPAGSTALSWGRFIAIGNEFDNFGRGTYNVLGCLYVYSGSEQSIISNNVFRNSVGSAATVKADGGSAVISGNSVYTNIGVTAAIAFFDQADVYASSSGRNLAITGNTVRAAENISILVDGARAGGLDDFDNVIIGNNVLDGAGSSVRGVHVRNVESVCITGNIVRATSGIGMFVEGCSGSMVIAENTIENGVVGVDVNGATSAADVSIVRNTVRGMTAGVIKLRSAVKSFHINYNEITGGTTAFQTSGATDLSTIVGNTLVTANGWAKSGSYGQVIYRDIGDAKLTPQDFGAGTSVDDAAAISSAISTSASSGLELDWGANNYSVASEIVLTLTGLMRWKSSGAKITYTAAAATQTVLNLKLLTGSNYLVGPFTLDVNQKAFQGFRFEPTVQGTQEPDLLMEDTAVLNWYRSSTAFSGGDAIYWVGTFGRVHLIRPKVKGGLMAVGAGVSGSEGIFGITGMRTTASGSNECARYVKIEDPWVENIWSEDAAWAVDQDAIRVFTRYGGGATSGKNNPHTVELIGGRVINVRGRSVKLQTESGRITGLKMYRTTLANAGVAGKRSASADIDVQTGGCIISDLEFNYDDYSHYAFVRIVQAGEGVPYGLPHSISNIIASVAGAYAPTYGFLLEANSGTGLTQTFTTVLSNVNINNETAIIYGIYSTAADATTNNVLLASNIAMKLGTAMLRYVSAGHTADSRFVNACQLGSSVPLLSGGAAGLVATGLNSINLT